MTINVTFRQLEAFLAVVRTLSFSEASKRIHLSQPALSAAVRKLEDAVGARLFDRDTRNVTLTPVGAELLVAAESLTQDLESALASVREYLAGKRGRISLAVAPTLAAGFAPQVIAAFQRPHPNVTVQLHDTLSSVSLDLVREGKVDLALTAETRADPSLDYQELFLDHLVLLCRSDHPLAKRRSVTWRDIVPLEHISLKRTSNVRDLVESAYVSNDAALRPRFEVDHASTVVGLVAAGLGVGALPYMMIRHLNLGSVVFRRITGLQVHRQICIVTLKSRTPSPATQAFIACCTEQAGKLQTPPEARGRRS